MKTTQPRIAYFKTREGAIEALDQHIDATWPNRFQDARSIARLKLVEFTRGFAWQKGDYGPYMTTGDMKTLS